jgi:hypothetical protein
MLDMRHDKMVNYDDFRENYKKIQMIVAQYEQQVVWEAILGV